jgi:hypothetical protein
LLINNKERSKGDGCAGVIGVALAPEARKLTGNVQDIAYLLNFAHRSRDYGRTVVLANPLDLFRFSRVFSGAGGFKLEEM